MLQGTCFAGVRENLLLIQFKSLFITAGHTTMITVRLKNVQADDQDHSNPLLGNKKTLFVVIDINSLQKNEGF